MTLGLLAERPRERFDEREVALVHSMPNAHVYLPGAAHGDCANCSRRGADTAANTSVGFPTLIGLRPARA